MRGSSGIAALVSYAIRRPGPRRARGAAYPATGVGLGRVFVAEAVDTFVLTSPGVQIGMFCPYGLTNAYYSSRHS